MQSVRLAVGIKAKQNHQSALDRHCKFKATAAFESAAVEMLQA
jgi:hypothetical protein